MAPLLKFASSTWFRRNSETPRTCTWALQENSSTSCASSWRDLPGLDVQSKCQQHHSSLPAVVKQTLSLCPGKVQGTLSPNYPILQIKKWDVKQQAPVRSLCDSQDSVPPHMRRGTTAYWENHLPVQLLLHI